MENHCPKFLVIGAGISGLCIALDLAEAGHQVVIVEEQPFVGGLLPFLDHQFPDNHCGMCRILPMVKRDPSEQFCLKRGGMHDSIKVYTSSSVKEIQGANHDFIVTLCVRPEGVDPFLCTRCSECADLCPVKVLDPYFGDKGFRKAIYTPVFGRPGRTPVIDWDNCTKCNECVKACPNHAISLEEKEQTVEIQAVYKVVMASGRKMYDPGKTDLYGYNLLADVVTATQFERMLSSSGPFKGKSVKTSNGKAIEKIAWIQCVGSRNLMINAEHCSTSCCMFAVKQAVLGKQKLGKKTDTAIFYMDMRTCGRDFQRYKDMAETAYGVRFIRCRIHSIDPGAAENALGISYIDDNGKAVLEDFDMVVLSTGIDQNQKMPEFILNDKGVGAVEIADETLSLKDISKTILKARCTVSRLVESINIDQDAVSAPGKSLSADDTNDHQKEKPVYVKKPSVLIVIWCNPDIIKPTVNIGKIEEQLNNLPGSNTVLTLSDDFRNNGPASLVSEIDQLQPNRLVIAGLNVDLFKKQLFRKSSAAGLAPSFMELVDLSLLSIDKNRHIQTSAVVNAIEMAVSRLVSRKPLKPIVFKNEQRALVLGSGPSGLSAALAMANLGIDVDLVEKKDRIAWSIDRILDPDVKPIMARLKDEAVNHSSIVLHPSTTLYRKTGRSGGFLTTLKTTNGYVNRQYGAVIVATGGRASDPGDFGLGASNSIITHYDLEQKIHDKNLDLSTITHIVMIQCAGSRKEPQNYCSRTCCIKTLKTAIFIRTHFPKIQIHVFYRDIMTCGEDEKLYTLARKNKIRFIPYDKKTPPKVGAESGKVQVNGVDPLTGEAVCFTPDLVSLAVGLVPNANDALRKEMNLAMTVDGFIKEVDYKWRPVDTQREGVFVCGLARTPEGALEAAEEGRAAAWRAARILKSSRITSQRISANVRHAICSLCEMCIDACPYHARYIDKITSKIMVDHAACQGCGTCASVCPNSATIMGEFEDAGVMNMIETALYD